MPTRIRPPDSQPPLQDGTQNPSHNSLQTRGSLPSGEVPAARITGPQNSTVQPSALPSTQPLGNQNETRPGTSGLAPRRAPFRSNVVETDPNRVATRPLRASGTTTDQDPAPPSTIQIHPADVWRSAAAVAMDDDQVINGRLVRLEQVIGSGGDKEARKRAVQTYWQLAVAIADYRFAVEEHQWMQDIGTTPRTADQTLWQAAVAEAEARMQEARLAVVNKQYDLIDASPLTTDRGLPVPSDAPLVTKYRTNYEAYAKSGRWPQSLGKIDRSLPMVQELIKVRARAVHMSRLAFFETSNAMTLGQASMSDVLDSIRRVRDQRLAFLGVLRDYNQLIAEYALTVGPAGADADRVVAMLIKRSSTDSTPTGNVRQATAIEQRPATGWRSIIRE